MRIRHRTLRSCRAGAGELAILLGGVLIAALADPAAAQTGAKRIDIPAAPLPRALQAFARQSGVELLFDQDQVAGVQAPALRGTFTPEAALGRLLAGTSLSVRRASSGALIVEPAAAPPLARQDATVFEVLVVGRQTQNADIRRFESDIQPYRVATQSQIVTADRDNLDQYFRSRVTSNTAVVPPSLDVKGETNSEIDLRGLGANDTLILIDGRRMPGIPAAIFGFRQPDLNALPLHALERVETLTGTAGGIHGFGALGGVVNVVLARDREGVELHVTGGSSTRGDARHMSVEGRAAFTLNEGRTRVMLHAGGSRADPLLGGDRPYMSEDLQRAADSGPQLLLSLRSNGETAFVSNTAFNQPLTLKPQYGGGTLASYFTYLPAGLSGAPGEVGAALAQNAGSFGPAVSVGEAASQLGSDARTGALLANVRHRFDGGVEAYVDAVMLSNHGRYLGYQEDSGSFLAPSSPLNPFNQTIRVTYPVPQVSRDLRVRFDSGRFTAGLITPLPLDWRATTEFTLGRARYEAVQSSATLGLPSFGGPEPNPFGNWSDFQALLAAHMVNASASQKITNRFRDLSLRLAGPVFHTAAGPSTLTLLAEHRVEDVPGYEDLTVRGGVSTLVTYAARESVTRSLYGELRSRLFDDDAPAPFLRDLELQLAVRSDTETNDFSRNPRSPNPNERIKARFSGTSYTVGGKVSPLSWLTLRGSYATGERPPPLANLIETTFTAFFRPADDPKRGGRGMPGNPPFIYRSVGSPDLTTVQASTASLGGSVAPFGEDGPRLRLDYSRIRKTGDVFTPSDQQVLANEDAWPERVTRAPLSDADRARGYTAGPITMLDARPANAGGLEVDTIDARLEWLLPFLAGNLRLYGEGTYYVRQLRTAPFQNDQEQVGYLNRPLKRRANMGAEWTRGPVTLAANLQYFGSYRIFPPGQFAHTIATATSLQGADRVPAQSYLDLHLDWRPRLNGVKDVKVGLGVINLLDEAPPRESAYSLQQFGALVAPASPGYSRYGDPRQRRVQLTLSSAF